MPQKISVVNFGASNASLSTVGYRILNSDLTTQTARTTSGVTEVISACGIYRATVTHPANFRGVLLWDTGEATPQYAGESLNPLDGDNLVDDFRTLLRSLNTSLSSHLERILGLQEKEKEIDFSSVNDQIKEAIAKFSEVYCCVKEIEINPQVNVNLENIEKMLSDLKSTVLEDSESNKRVLASAQNAVTARTSAMSQDVQKMLSQAVIELKRMEDSGEKMFSSKMDFVKKALDKAVDTMLGEITDSVETLVKRLSEKGRAEELLETISGAVREVGSGEGVKKKPAMTDNRDLINLMLSLKR